MKKLLLATFGLIAGATLVHAQGYLLMYGPVADITTNTAFYDNPGLGYGISGKTFSSTVALGAYDYALLYATTVTAADTSPLGPDWNLVTLYGGGTLLGNNFIVPGGMSGPGSTAGIEVNL